MIQIAEIENELETVELETRVEKETELSGGDNGSRNEVIIKEGKEGSRRSSF